MSVSTSFLDNVTEPHNFNPDLAPFDLIVSELFLKLESTNHENKSPFSTVSAKKVNIIEEFIKLWRTHFGVDISQAIRLIFPNKDSRKYFIKDVALTRLIIKLLNLKPGSTDYLIIKNWKKSYQQKVQLAGVNETQSVGDLPLIIARIMLRRRDTNSVVKSSVTVKEINDVLDKLCQTSKVGGKVELLKPLFDKLTITEIRFMFQIILKESMLSFFERSFFVSWHPDAYNLYKVCDDIKKIFWLLTDPDKRLTPQQLCVQPMYAFVPQSSKSLVLSYDNLCKKMKSGMTLGNKDAKLVELYNSERIQDSFLIEEKIDGDRMLMHMVNGTFKWHTRRRRDYTFVYGENYHIGSLTKHLQSAFHPNVKSVILDGEMVAWSKDRDLILPFGTLRSAAVQEALRQFDVVDVYEGNNSWPLFIIFDILHLNGEDLTQLPLFYRKNLLKKVITNVPHRFETLEWVKASTPDDIKKNMQIIVTERNEGIMVKSLLLKYRVHSRDSTWIKVKPEYLENFGENLDLVVIAKIGRIKTSYICGLRDEEEEGCFKLFCMVANGFLRAVYRQIESKLCNFWVDYKERKPPPELVKFGTRKPDFWINPANLIVLEIKARSIEVTADTPYAAGLTLHNLWCRAVREDKGYEDCVTLQQYERIKTRYSTDIYKKQVVNRGRKRAFENSVYDRAEATKKHKVEVKNNLFHGLSFIIATDFRDPSTYTIIPQEEIGRQIKQHGGSIVLSPKGKFVLEDKIIILGEHSTPRILRWVKQGFDVIHPKWAYDCLRCCALVEIEPQHIEESSGILFEHAINRTDEFGDSYTLNPANPREYFAWLAKLKMVRQISDEGLEKCRLAFYGKNEACRKELLRNLKFHVVGRGENLDAIVKKIQRRILRFGGDISPLVEKCQMVIAPDEVISNIFLLDQVRAASRLIGQTYIEGMKIPLIVTASFITRCIEENKLVDEAEFKVVIPGTAGFDAGRG